MFTSKKSASARKAKKEKAASGARGSIKNMLINMPAKKRKADVISV